MGRKQRTRVNNTYSSWASPETGVPQGSILGPLKFDINLNDLFYALEEEDIANYADDNTPYETGPCLECVLKALEDNIHTLLKWFDQNLFKVNADKCHLLIPKMTQEVTLNIRNEVILNENSLKCVVPKLAESRENRRKTPRIWRYLEQ